MLHRSDICEICGLECNETRIIDRYPLKGCNSCGDVYLAERLTADPEEGLYSDSYFTSGGAGYADYLSQRPQMVARGLRYARLAERCVGFVGKGYDAGAAACFPMQGFRRAGWNPFGVEPNNTMARSAREEFHLPAQTGAFEQVESGRIV